MIEFSNIFDIFPISIVKYTLVVTYINVNFKEALMALIEFKNVNKILRRLSCTS